MFLSYARRDGVEHVRWLDEQLLGHGVDTWRDKRDIDATADFTAELEIAIRACRAVVLCISEGATRPDSFVRREIVFAQLAHKPIVVARFADVVPPISVVTNTYLDFYTAPQEAQRLTP